ncbi:MAG: hypothetical protein HYR49_04175 [Gammaproteobacteria bacterium]|nr:hypothetical protein [Gammaproteobacteria bacterium]
MTSAAKLRQILKLVRKKGYASAQDESAGRQAEQPGRAFTGVGKGEWAATKGYYRLMDQPADSAVTMEAILQPHREQTLRMQAHARVERLQRAIAINLVIAWRIMVMTLPGREVPELPAEVLFSDLEIEVLLALQELWIRGRASRCPGFQYGRRCVG